MDFEEVREYVPGDEVRYIDWNVSARMNSPHVKVFREEREMTMVLAVDISGSADLGSGTQSKRELMAEVAAVLAFSASRNNDQVALLLFTDEVEHFIPVGKGRKHILRLIRQILFFEPTSRGTHCEKALEYLNHVAHRNSMVFLISDFLDEGFEKALRITAQRYDLVPVLTVDERELELPDVGVVAFEDAETGEIVEVDTSNSALREAFSCAAHGRVDRLRKEFISYGVDVIEIRNGQPYIDAFHQFFKNRIKRR
jgi:uncharacterized protein (DUF58 family)